jgi:hypothetical protein
MAAPQITYYGPRVQKLRVSSGTAWSPLSPESKAKCSTGFNPVTRQLELGVFIRTQVSHAVIGFDVFRTSLTLKREALSLLKNAWLPEAASLPQRLRDKAHFSSSFVEIPMTRERIEHWKAELESVLGDSGSYEQL